MTDLLTALTNLFTFLFTQMGNIASFFVTNTLGIVIFGLVIFSVLVYLFIYILEHIR